MKKILSLGKYSMDGKLLGCGNFGRVELATHVLTNIKVAIKIIDTRKLTTSYASKNLYREAKILAQIRHPNIVRIYETLKASYLYCLVLEYISMQDLNDYLKTLPGCRMSERECWPIMRQIASALIYLHQHSIVHRDLKMDNILLDDRHENVKIIDFGLSNMFAEGQLLHTHCGSPEFAAPELFYDRHDYGPEVDAWSFGVILYGTLCGKLPFVPGSTEPSKRHALLKMLTRGLVQEHKTHMCHLSLDCRSMLLQLIEPKPQLRLTMFQVVEHDWVTRDGRYPVEADMLPPRDEPLRAKVVAKLAELHSLDLDYVENHVSETKYDGISSQYNMLMDRYSHIRRVQGITGSTQPTKLKKRSKPQPIKPQQALKPCLKKSSTSSAPRMRGILNSLVKDDTIVGMQIANKLLTNTIQDPGNKLVKPTITFSGCQGTDSGNSGFPTSNQGTSSLLKDGMRLPVERAQMSLPVTVNKHNLSAECLTTESAHRISKDTLAYATEVSPSQCMTISTASTILQDLLRTDNSTHQNLADMASWKSQGSEGNTNEAMTTSRDSTDQMYGWVQDSTNTVDLHESLQDRHASADVRKPLSRNKCWIKGSATLEES